MVTIFLRSIKICPNRKKLETFKRTNEKRKNFTKSSDYKIELWGICLLNFFTNYSQFFFESYLFFWSKDSCNWFLKIISYLTLQKKNSFFLYHETKTIFELIFAFEAKYSIIFCEVYLNEPIIKLIF